MRSTDNFPEWEWNCKCNVCGREESHSMQSFVMHNVQSIRNFLDRPVILTSAYRCKFHPAEIEKYTPGQHNLGLAIDIEVEDGYEAAKIIKFAFINLGLVGFSYNKELGFLHLDWRDGAPITWNY